MSGAAVPVEVGLDASWTFGGAVHGGHLLGVVAGALGQAVVAAGGQGDPLSVSGYYLTGAHPGPAQVAVSVARVGRSLSTASGSVLQAGEGGAPVERLRVLGTFAELSSDDDDVRTAGIPPDMPPPEVCRPCPGLLPGTRLDERAEVRLDPSFAGWIDGSPSGRGEVRGWVRPADGRAPDVGFLFAAVDVLPSTAFDLGLSGYVPTLELTVHVRARPAPGWLRVSHATRNLAGGYLEEDAEVWDCTGRLVAQSRQLARAPRS